MTVTRRQFLKLTGIFAAATAIPIASLAVTVELEAVIDDKLLGEAISIGKFTQGGAEATIDMDKMWQAVCFVDQWGNEWRTEDGESWAWAGHSFELEG